jgi:hypothetical protein
MSVEYSILLNFPFEQMALIVVGMSLSKEIVAAVFDRDNYQCQIPIKHECHRHLDVHHINKDLPPGLVDQSGNLLTACKDAHLNIIHKNGNNTLQFQKMLHKIAVRNTEQAKKRGWHFPDQ